MLRLCIFFREKVLKRMSTMEGWGGGGGGDTVYNDSVLEWLSLHIHILYIEVFIAS